MTMRSAGLIAVLAAFAVAAHAMPADAAPRKKASAQRGGVNQNTVVVTRDENGRTRTRIIVTPRSYLDGGTEVLPGQRKYSDYAFPPYYSPTDSLGSLYNHDRQPLNSRWELGAPRY